MVNRSPKDDNKKDTSSEEAKDVVISVRMPKLNLARIGSYAKIKGISANEAIRQLTMRSLNEEVQTPEFKAAAAAFIAAAQQQVNVLYAESTPQEPEDTE